MSVGKFLILLTLAFIVAGMVCLEISHDNQVLSLTATATSNQMILSQAQQQRDFLRQLVQRLANESPRDPDIASLLAKHGVHLKSTPPPTGDSGTAPQPAPATTPVATP